MITHHYTGNHSVNQLISVPFQMKKQTLVRSNYREGEFATKKQNILEQTNKTLQTILHAHESPFTKIGKPLRVVTYNQELDKPSKSVDQLNEEINTNPSSKSIENQHGNQKMGAKLKHKLNCQQQDKHSPVSKQNITEPSTPACSQRLIQQQKMMELKEWVAGEIVKVNQKLSEHHQKIQKLSNVPKKSVEDEVFSGHQIEQLNKILSLVQKVGNRQDFKRTTKMIDQLRQNILQLHQQLYNLSEKQHKDFDVKLNRFDIHQNQIKTFKENLENIVKTQNESLQLNKKVIELYNFMKQPKKDSNNTQKQPNLVKSSKRFQGKMITLVYQQNILLPRDPKTKQNINETIINNQRVAQNKQSFKNSTISQHIYYIDGQGYLLDSDGFYLLNQKQLQIRLTENELSILRSHKLM